MLAAGAALLALALAPASAHAAQVSVSNGTLTYDAAPGETNTPALGSLSGRFYVRDATANLAVSGPGCSESDAHTVSCPDTAVSRLVIDAGEGNDFIDLSFSFRSVPATLNGGAGNDTIKGGPGAETLDGGSGDDALRGNGGADVLRGGDGVDTASYAGRSTGVDVSLDDVANDGSPGEGDDVASDVENLTGTSAADTLTGSAADNALTGGGGPDVLDGAGGSDTLAGDDGDDVIAARDGQFDRVVCGAGADSVTADRIDLTSPDCETVGLPEATPPVPPPTGPLDPGSALDPPTLGAPTIKMPSRPIAVTPDGDVPLPVSCPASAQAKCAGYVTLTLLPSLSARISRRGECLRRSCRRPPRPGSGRVGSRHFLVQIGHIVRLSVGLSRYGQWKLRQDWRLKLRAQSYVMRGGRAVRTGSSVITLTRPRAIHRRTRPR